MDIKYIKDNAGNNFFPLVHEKGVVDDNGTTLESKLQSKQDAISDLSTIRSGAAAGATAVQSVTVGTTTTGAAGTNASVTNTGTATEPVLSFTIPQGAQGIQGIQGPQGERGPQGNTGVQVDSVASIIHSIEPTATYAAADVAGADAVQDVLAEVTELGGEVGDLTHSDFILYPGWMSSNAGKYAAQANTYFSVIPVRAGASYKIIKNPSNNAHLAFLNSFSGVPIGGSFDINGTRIVVTSSTPITGTVPAGATYIYLLRIYQNSTWQMPTIEIDGVDITKDLGMEILSLAQRQTESENALGGKQPTLVSGTNIKTINGQSLLGFGNISIVVDTQELEIELDMLKDGIFDDFVWTTGAFLHKNNGQPSTYASAKYTADYYRIKPGQYYLLCEISGNGCNMCFYDADKVYLNEYTQGVRGIYTIPNDAVFVRFSTSTNVQSPYIGSLTPNVAELNTRITTLESQVGGVPVKATRLFPNTKLPTISFIFDDCVDNDDLAASLFESKGVTCGFAFIASTANITSKSETYKRYQAKGHSILSHSVDATTFTTENYTQETARIALNTSMRRLENVGILVNGFVSPSSTFASEFYDIPKSIYAYAFTAYVYPNINNRSANPCQLTRKSLQATTIADLKTWIDSEIASDHIITLYGHTADFGNTYGGEEWNLTKLEEILDYCIAKRDAGLCWVGSPDNAIKYYYDL